VPDDTLEAIRSGVQDRIRLRGTRPLVGLGLLLDTLR
jgi:hypothetical protein